MFYLKIRILLPNSQELVTYGRKMAHQFFPKFLGNEKKIKTLFAICNMCQINGIWCIIHWVWAYYGWQQINVFISGTSQESVYKCIYTNVPNDCTTFCAISYY